LRGMSALEALTGAMEISAARVKVPSAEFIMI
jgi:hypothetical protein